MISIDDYLAQLQARKEHLQRQLSTLSTQMSDIRADDDQRRHHVLVQETPSLNELQLKHQQPARTQLRREIVAVTAEITRIQALKKHEVKTDEQRATPNELFPLSNDWQHHPLPEGPQKPPVTSREIIVMLILLFPFGFYLMWKRGTWSTPVKWLVTLAVIALVVSAGVASPHHQKQRGSSVPAPINTSTLPTTPANGAIATVLPTQPAGVTQAQPTVTIVPTALPATQPMPVLARGVPTPTQTPAPTPTPTPANTGVNGNPWGYDFTPGNLIYSPPSNFCAYFTCTANFPKGRGYVNECMDGTYTKSGGMSSDCVSHGGYFRTLYSHEY